MRAERTLLRDFVHFVESHGVGLPIRASLAVEWACALSTLIGLLASTVLRVGEALRLTVTDVVLESEPPCLHIRETKFYKSRLVPLHPSTANQLRHYVSVRTALHYDGLSDVFFVSEHGGPLHRSALWRWFTTRCRTLGMGATDAGRRPSLSALR